MSFGICLLSVVPCRKEPSGSSEMVTQLLFGEHYTVTEIQNDWVKVITAYDNYPCWLSVKQHNEISEITFKRLNKNKPVCVSEITHQLENKLTQNKLYLTLGASLPFLNKKTISFESFVFGYDGKSEIVTAKRDPSQIIQSAKRLLNSPYLWGGKTPFGIDCSGFTQLIFKMNGFKLPRDAWQQAEKGQTLDFVEEAQTGDLAFFDNEEGKIVHVGILINNQQIIHASGFVRIDKFDHYGIFNSSNKKYSHTLRVIKRVI